MKTTAPIQIVASRVHKLTEREREILALFAAGHKYAEIGERLDISAKTVGSYLQRVREKFRTKTRADMIALAIAEGLLAASPRKAR